MDYSVWPGEHFIGSGGGDGGTGGGDSEGGGDGGDGGGLHVWVSATTAVGKTVGGMQSRSGLLSINLFFKKRKSK